jgi:two-component system NtrC family sensor kinase
LGKLTAGIAHEINNPMRFITNYAELNREALIEIYDHIETTISAHHIELGEVYQELKASTLRTLEVINEQGSRVSGIIASMLALSREGSGEKSFVDLISLIRLSAKILGEELESAITQSLPEDPVMISLAWDEMSQVFSNIFQNAAYAVEKKMELSDRRYTPEIAVSIHQTSEQVRVEIRDNGIGIKADDAPKIGTPFFTTKEVGEGTGLGISIAREIVEKIHAGHLSISGTEGQGATVVITLPKDGR